MAKDIEKCTPVEIEKRVEKAWKVLNKLGIYTMEEFDEAYKNMKPINISCMAGKIKKTCRGLIAKE